MSLEGGMTLIFDEYGASEVRDRQAAVRQEASRRCRSGSRGGSPICGGSATTGKGASLTRRFSAMHRQRSLGRRAAPRRGVVTWRKEDQGRRREPTSVTSALIQVGFGDCFLLTFNYGEDAAATRRHVLIDFGSTALPKQGAVPCTKMANEIKKKTARASCTPSCATHRHRDHISGFGGKPGKIIAALNPDVVVQPWTEHPRCGAGARSAPAPGAARKGSSAPGGHARDRCGLR